MTQLASHSASVVEREIVISEVTPNFYISATIPENSFRPILLLRLLCFLYGKLGLCPRDAVTTYHAQTIGPQRRPSRLLEPSGAQGGFVERKEFLKIWRKWGIAGYRFYGAKGSILLLAKLG